MRRYERERGPGKLAVLLKLAPNVFGDSWSGSAEAVQGVVDAFLERARANVLGPDSTDPLDLVQVVWWDFKVRPCGGIPHTVW